MMSHRSILIALIAGSMLCVSNPVSAWDGERKGFLIGLDAGFGLAATFQTRPFVDNGLGLARPGTNPPRDNSPLLGADFMMGYGPNNNFEVFAFTNTNYFNIAYVDPTTIAARISSYTINQLSGIGFSYYKKQAFLPSAPAGFVSVGVGVSMIRPSTTTVPTRYGPGFTVAGGYEFKKYIRAKLAFTWSKATAKITTTQTDNFDVAPWTLRLSIGVLGY